MGFFDLNVPYLEGESTNPIPDNTTRKNTRLKIVVKAMELGYTGVAYNRSIKGVMSDKDICTISHFPLSSLLKLSPNLSTSVKFHRELLGVPTTTLFRQYTRLTVLVDSLIQCSALNSGNQVLKTYDLVAVRPLNQATFEHVCKSAEVDLIAIDFTVCVPFRMMFESLQTALMRGVYFEITYSPLISDVQIRKQIILTTKLLVEWTRGKNLIFSSAAVSVTEIRGPCDVANLSSSVLGISMERSKAAISKNCRSLLSNAIGKKKYYKNAIKVDRISSGELVDSNDWFCEGNDWDHVSSAEGNMQLDDIANSFGASSKVSKISKAIDFASISYEKSSYGMQLRKYLPGIDDKVHPPKSPFAVREFGNSSDKGQVLKQGNNLGVDPSVCGILSAATPFKQQISGGKELSKAGPGNDISAVFTDGKNDTLPTCSEEGKGSDGAVSIAVEMMSDSKASEDCVLDSALVTPTEGIQTFENHADANGSSDHDMISSSSIENNHINSVYRDKLSCHSEEMAPSSSRNGNDSRPNITDVELATQTFENHADAKGSPDHDMISSSSIENNHINSVYRDKLSCHSEEMAPSSSRNGNESRPNITDVELATPDVSMMCVSSKKEESGNTNIILAGCDMSVIGDYASNEKHRQCKDPSDLQPDDKILGESLSKMHADTNFQAGFVPPEGASVEPDDRKQFKSGRSRSVQRVYFRAFPFSRHGLLFSKVFKKKSYRKMHKSVS